MKRVQSLLLFFIATPFAHAVETVPFVDLNRYMGKWYEISSIPARFQKRCIKNTTAEYRLLETGKVDVINSCDTADGDRLVANGLAQVKNTQTQAELGVSFVPFFNHFGWFEGQYKVLALSSDYSYVLVGEDSRRFGWILSRTPALPFSVLQALESEIVRQGYNPCDFLTSLQDGGSFSERKPLCEVLKAAP